MSLPDSALQTSTTSSPNSGVELSSCSAFRFSIASQSLCKCLREFEACNLGHRFEYQGQTDQDGVWGRMAHSLRQRPSNSPSLRRNSWPSSNPPPGPCGLRRTSGLHLAFVEPSRFFSALSWPFVSVFVEPPPPSSNLPAFVEPSLGPPAFVELRLGPLVSRVFVEVPRPSCSSAILMCFPLRIASGTMQQPAAGSLKFMRDASSPGRVV